MANASLSDTYNPRRAVTDYFAAQRNRDVERMLANATFVRGDGSYAAFFGKAALTGMMDLPANSDLGDVRIRSVRDVDRSTKSITVSLPWKEKERSQVLTVRKDATRVHWFFYPSWKVEIPSVAIQVKLPNQAGAIRLDGIPTPAGSNPSAIQAIRGFHRVTMESTSLLDGASQDIDAVDLTTTATAMLPGVLRPSAVAAAGAAVKRALDACDPARRHDCVNHTYTAPRKDLIYYFPLPGYGDVDYANYRSALANDPTEGMKLMVEAEPERVYVSGTCVTSLTIDEKRSYTLKGIFWGTLTWQGGTFDPNLIWDCWAEKG